MPFDDREATARYDKLVSNRQTRDSRKPNPRLYGHITTSRCRPLAKCVVQHRGGLWWPTHVTAQQYKEETLVLTRRVPKLPTWSKMFIHAKWHSFRSALIQLKIHHSKRFQGKAGMHAVCTHACMHVNHALHYAPSAVTSIVKHAPILGLAFRRWQISFCLHFYISV